MPTNLTTTIQWVFSGIGVLIVGWGGTWIYRRFRRREEDSKSTQVILNSQIVGPVAGRDINIETYQGGNLETDSADDYRPTPAPAEIWDNISKVSLYARQSVANNYEGLKVRWSGTLENIHHPREDQIEVTIRTEKVAPASWVYVVAPIRLSDYPILKTVHGGEPLTVTGTIDRVQTNGMIHLTDAKLRFS